MTSRDEEATTSPSKSPFRGSFKSEEIQKYD